ncbi:hypothetical protein MPH_00327 [Macrophomina phaseolina MS6]|uniref:Uncharacterized protein n=2 Tax=Macrophomina phaseolina TaxID=35725 RepID=K2SBN8_MACPH|nr:hypothetical protein MPH_00327 [Macrophomina phaseolina MS6]KAH7025408.1 hypothetical protein B0J12DRAFT_385437 [Macrophomina phaseolina]
MKVSAVIFALLPFVANVMADSHGACACQSGSDRGLVEAATNSCCTLFQGSTASFLEGGKIKYQGIYCLKDGIDGDSWYNCCRNQQSGKGDSACPW